MGVGQSLEWTYDSSQGLNIETPGALKSKQPEIALLGYGFMISV